MFFSGKRNTIQFFVHLENLIWTKISLGWNETRLIYLFSTDICLSFYLILFSPPCMWAWKSLGSRPPTDNCLVKKNGKLDFFFIYYRSQGKVSLYTLFSRIIVKSTHLYIFKGTVHYVQTFLILKINERQNSEILGELFQNIINTSFLLASLLNTY